MRSSFFTVATALAVLQVASAQTFTSCNPLDTTCPADPALGKTISVDFTKGASNQFTLAEGTTLKYGANGAEFTIAIEGQAPTITSSWYIMFGSVEVVMKASPGVGIVSSFVLQSDDLDEVDWEWLGAYNYQVQSNYYGKGDHTTYDRVMYHNMAPPVDDFHTYKIIWTSSSLQWLIDGVVVRTLNYADAQGGARYPQTPMQVKLGSWGGGNSASPEGTVTWAGGHVDYTQAPFTMYVKSLTITDGTTSGSEYVYGDKSGSWQSIKVEGSPGGAFIDTNSTSSTSTKASSTTTTTSTTAHSTTVAPTSSNSTTASTATTGSATTTAPTTSKSSGAAATQGVAAAALVGAGLLGLLF